MPEKSLVERIREFAEACPCPVGDPVRYADELITAMERINSDQQYKNAADIHRALADEKRLRILAYLRIREMCVCELTVAVDANQSNVSHHLAILERADLIARRKDGKFVYYKARPAGLDQV